VCPHAGAANERIDALAKRVDEIESMHHAAVRHTSGIFRQVAAHVNEIGAMAAGVDELERLVAEMRAAVIVSPAGLGGPLPALQLAEDAVETAVAVEPLHGSLTLEVGSRVVVLMDRAAGGVWLGTLLRRTEAGLEVDLGRAGVLVVAADRVSPVPEAWR
jgi:hypothetical protein